MSSVFNFPWRGGKANKYHNVASGHYASHKESRRAAELRLMQQAGLISGLREQVHYELIPEQRDADGHLIERPCNYVADFTYYLPDGTAVVEDTKGVRTPAYVIKRKLMLRVHGIRIKES